MPFHRPLLLLPVVLALGLAAGCGEAKVSSYRAPKEAAPALPSASNAPAAAPAAPAAAPAAGGMAGVMAATAVPTAGGSDLKWTAPAHWESKPASSMRKATYVIKGDGGAEAELSVTAFPGDVGGETANLVRWRTQVGLPDVSAAELAAGVTRFEAGGLKIAVTDFANEKATPPQRLLGAIVPAGANTWFFKLTGPPVLLGREKQAFLDFLKTLKAP